jgi:hypothetical protein
MGAHTPLPRPIQELALQLANAARLLQNYRAEADRVVADLEKRWAANREFRAASSSQIELGCPDLALWGCRAVPMPSDERFGDPSQNRSALVAPAQVPARPLTMVSGKNLEN